MLDVEPSGAYSVSASLSVLPSSESVQYPVRSVRPFILRTTTQLLGPFTVTDRVVPRRPGWSLPSATTVSTRPGAKVMAYLFAPATSTFISSLGLLLDGFTFHLPTKGSFAAHSELVTRQATSSYRKVRLNIWSSLNVFSFSSPAPA